MFLTKECDYAIRVVRGLANFEVQPVQEICEREYVPRPFAYKILKKLERAGIVRAHRGAAGGYQLAKNLDDVVLFEIVNAIDENLFINECLKNDHICPNNINGKHCGIHDEITRIQHILIDALSENKVSMIV